MDVDYEELSTTVICEENCSRMEEVPGAPIVNVDANFLVPPDQQGLDGVFPRLRQGLEMAKIAEKAGSLVDLRRVPEAHRNSRPYRRPDFADEWKMLKKAWSLARNGHTKLSERRVIDASKEYYFNDPLSDLPDWIWRFAFFSSQASYEPVFRELMAAIQPLFKSGFTSDFLNHINAASAARAGAYYGVIRDFYAGYEEFGQVYIQVLRGVEIHKDLSATSTDFQKVKMFYGNTFETFATLIERLAFINNLLSGREYDQFEKLTLEQYRGLDKSSRFGPFSANPAFVAVASEANNRIRNASHHGSFELEIQAQSIVYRAGKGGTGSEERMSYADYLIKCVKIYLQVLVLLRLDLILSSRYNLSPPV